MRLLLGALALLLVGALGALAAYRRPRLSSALAASGAVAGALLGIYPASLALLGAPASELRLAWSVPGGEIVLGLDPLSGFFLVALFLLAGAAAIYGRAYLHPSRADPSGGPGLLAHGESPRVAVASGLFNLTVASMALVLLARHALLFLVVWEMMSLGSYLLVSFDHHEPEVRRAGWVYLISTHLGLACLTGLVLLLGDHAGALTFAAFEGAPLAGTLPFVLALLGFGIKAGLVPLHVWLPEAHAAAPSHVSALMSGILIKLGLYGLLRTFTFLEPARFWGPTLMLLGLAGAALGISLALYQRDLKRVLAYSSIENVGVVVLGFGIAFLGAERGHPTVAALGAFGGLLHLFNHTLLKGLMFLCAGSVLQGSGTRDLERLGGLLKRMPWTGTLMLGGAVALSALPPLNAFLSEWLIALGLLKGATAIKGSGGLLLLFALGALAVVGGLAALCYARLVGVALLGQPRSPEAGQAREAPGSMIGPMLVLAIGALLISLVPGAVLSALGPVVQQTVSSSAEVDLGAVLRPVAALTTVTRVVWVALAAVAIGLAWLLRGKPRASDETWGCGYLAPTARMQYTARSFSEMVAEGLLPRRLGARLQLERPDGLLPSTGRFSADSTDPLTRGLYQPLFDRWTGRLGRLRWLQRGILHVYLLYILLVVLAALAWSSVRDLVSGRGGLWP